MALKLNPVTGELDLVMAPGGGIATVSFTTDDAGTAFPTGAGNITVAGGTGINTASSLNTVTVNLDSPVLVVDGGTGNVSLTDGGVMLGSGTGAVTVLGQATDGQLVIGSTGTDPALAALVGGAGVTITNGPGTIQIDVATGGFTWTEVTGTSATMTVESGFIANNAALVTLTLPATCAVGDTIQAVGKGAGLFRIAQQSGQSINITASTTTVGAGGSLTAIEQFAALELVCTVANTTFTVLDTVGNFTVV